MKHKCGICGVSLKENAQGSLYKMLLQLQHRGQLSAGITAYRPDESLILVTHKELGLVNTVFRAEHAGKFASNMQKLDSKKGIGHVRYATCGADDKSYAQPFERTHGKKIKWFSFCFNGNISNYLDLKKDLEENNYHLVRDTDTEVIMHIISKAMKDTGENNFVQVFSELSKKLDGSYNIAFINAEGTLIAARDPIGFRPLCYAIKDGEAAFASESVALNYAGFGEVKDLEPGTMLIVEKDSFRIERFAESPRCAHCFFEWVYFAHPASVIDGKLVYEVRRSLGELLAKLETQKLDKDCIVVPVPDSSTPSGEGFAEALGIPLKEGLIRNRYTGRTFIESNKRGERVSEKFMLIKQLVEGKKVFLVEDSIVRGTTLKHLIAFIRKVGKPKEVHVRVSCPPITSPCFYGIDMSSKKELIANQKSVDEIAKEVGADSLIYQSMENLVKAVGLEKNKLCLACLNGEYPTKNGELLSNFCDKGRAHECKKCTKD
ncbi:MAG: amidophosphoribosyltransferase [archaeon]